MSEGPCRSVRATNANASDQLPQTLGIRQLAWDTEEIATHQPLKGGDFPKVTSHCAAKKGQTIGARVSKMDSHLSNPPCVRGIERLFKVAVY